MVNQTDEPCPKWVSKNPILNEIYQNHRAVMQRAKQIGVGKRELPNSTDLSIGEKSMPFRNLSLFLFSGDFLKVEDIAFLCVRWDRAWNNLLADEVMHQFL